MTEPRNADNWAKPIEQFHVEELAEGARKGNVEGRKPTGPLQGFGQLWQKTYEVSIPGPTPEEVIKTWKENFGEFWYPSNKFYAPAAGIAPGEIAMIAGGKGPTKVTSGVRVIYADETSWSYMTPEGHPWAAIITFSLFSGIPVELEEAAWTLGCTRVQAFRKVILPLALPGITASAIFAFVISWNEVFAAAVLTIENRTLTAFLLQSLDVSPLPLKFAGGAVLVLPALAFIFAVRKYLFAMWGIANR